MNESNRLPILFNEIQAAHREAWTAARMAIDKAREAGKGLAEAKGLLGHGQWLPWLRRLGIEPRTAQRYMKLARMTDDKYDTVSYLGIRGALEAVVEQADREPRYPKLFQLFLTQQTKLAKVMAALEKECPSAENLSDLIRELEQEGGDGVDDFIDLVKTASELNRLSRELQEIVQFQARTAYKDNDGVVWLAFELDGDLATGWDGPTTKIIEGQCYSSIPYLKKLAPHHQSDLEKLEQTVRAEPDQAIWRELTVVERARRDRAIERSRVKRAATIDLKELDL